MFFFAVATCNWKRSKFNDRSPYLIFTMVSHLQLARCRRLLATARRRKERDEGKGSFHRFMVTENKSLRKEKRKRHIWTKRKRQVKVSICTNSKEIKTLSTKGKFIFWYVFNNIYKKWCILRSANLKIRNNRP